MIINKNIKLNHIFNDKRGSIQKIVEGIFHSSLLIETNKHSVRANHFHKKDSHYIYVLEGELVYFYKKINKHSHLYFSKFKISNLFYTPPLYEHVLFFTKKTKFLVFSPHKRSRKEYENDLVRLDMLSYPKIQKHISKYTKKVIT